MPPETAPVVLGIDGGGSKTQAALMDLSGRVLATGWGGPSNYHDIGVAAARANIQQAVEAAVAAAAVGSAKRAHPGGVRVPVTGVNGVRALSAFLGIGSTVVESDRQTVLQMARDLDLAEVIDADHDCRIALAGGLSGRPGMVLIAGTGSSCYGRTAAGDDWLCGGWGPLISDEGSGYWLGIQAMRAASRAADGRGPDSSLREMVRERLGLGEMRELMRRLYVDGLSRSEIAALASIVFDAARGGDETARAVLREGAAHLAEIVWVTACKLGFDRGPAELSLTGGLVQAGAVFLDPLREAVQARLPECRVMEAELPPAHGACLLALELVR